MSFDIRVSRKLPGHTLELEFRSGAGISALFGPSGVGKTSVLNMVAGVLRPDRGRIEVGGVTLFDSDARISLRPEQRLAGFIFQDGRLFPHMTVRRNLLYGAKLRSSRPATLSFDEVLSLLGIEHLLERQPASLSGGEAQRVAIGRALLSKPRFLLMDEPLTYLDDERREEILSIVRRLRDQWKLPILYVSHDRTELESLEATVIPMTLPSAPSR